MTSLRAPDRGDVVWLDFGPSTGHEQAGRRPAVILSPRKYNRRSGLSLACPITRRSKSYPFEVILPAGLPVQGVVLCDHIRNVDLQARNMDRICRLPDEVVTDILLKIAVLLT